MDPLGCGVSGVVYGLTSTSLSSSQHFFSFGHLGRPANFRAIFATCMLLWVTIEGWQCCKEAQGQVCSWQGSKSFKEIKQWKCMVWACLRVMHKDDI